MGDRNENGIEFSPRCRLEGPRERGSHCLNNRGLSLFLCLFMIFLLTLSWVCRFRYGLERLGHHQKLLVCGLTDSVQMCAGGKDVHILADMLVTP